MNKSFIIYSFLPVILLFSCKGNQAIDSPLKHFKHIAPHQLKVSEYIDLEKHEIYNPGTALKYENGYIIQNLVNEKIVSYIDITNNTVLSGIAKGEAPGDVLSVSKLQQMGKDFFMYDIMRKVVFKINLNPNSKEISLSEYKKVNVPKRLFNICILPDGIISTGIFDNGWLESYNDNDSLISFVPFPDFEETQGLTSVEKSAIYIASGIVSSPDFSKVVCAPQGAGVISFIKLNGNKMEEYKRLMYNPPLITAPRTAGATAIVYKRDAKVAFHDLVCGDDFVMALYSGRTANSHGTTACNYCEHVLVYDWDGNPIHHFLLEKPLSSLGYDRDNRILYGIGYDPEGMIIKYDLKDIPEWNN